MSRDEAKSWLLAMQKVLSAERQWLLACEVEDVLYRLERFTSAQLREYAQFIIPPGKSGHVRMVLYPPYEVRAKAMIVGILKEVT
jgi:hypothetical protein